jgi:hypothetical protein
MELQSLITWISLRPENPATRPFYKKSLIYRCFFFVSDLTEEFSLMTLGDEAITWPSGIPGKFETGFRIKASTGFFL